VSVVLGVDLGERRVGIACGDTATGLVIPLLTFRRGTPAQDAAALARVIAERRADAVVVGLPLHLDGRESEQARRTRAWVAAVGPMLALPMSLRDERLSSHLAEERLGPPRRGRNGGAPSPAARRARRARIDREAAALLVRGELEARAAADHSEARP
jgi:putative Holliday junction resolvase